ncbi:BatD family protein [uncultured Flavobacterium sp.]|uniref:BatD family protein n=1 Tax=uncultured Flavobacterium sp. TaxID=165435 RepID=UPI0025D7A221|nr:BatD family protein [uncultured Flavobacterium sp.]
MKRYIILLLLSAQGIIAQVVVTAKTSKNVILRNETVMVYFTANTDEGNFAEPSFDGFTIISGPKKTADQSSINGKQNYLMTMAYELSPSKLGAHTIPSLEYETDDKIYQTKPIVIFVSEISNGKKDAIYENAKKQIHLVPEISRSSVAVGEEVTVTYRLYIKEDIGLETIRIVNNLEYKNLDAKYETGDIQSKKPGKTFYNGYICKFIDVKKLVLHPKELGKLEIEPLTLEAEVDILASKTSNKEGIIKRKILVVSPPMNIDVKSPY